MNQGPNDKCPKTRLVLGILLDNQSRSSPLLGKLKFILLGLDNNESSRKLIEETASAIDQVVVVMIALAAFAYSGR